MLIGSTIPDRPVEFSGHCDEVGTKQFPSEFFQTIDTDFLVLYFYPGDFTSICATEVLAFENACPEMREMGASIVACSINNPHAHNAWKRRPKHEGGLGTNVSHALIADVTGALSKEFDVLIPSRHVATRGLFILDRSGQVLYESRSDTKTARNVYEILNILRELKKLANRPGKRERAPTL